MLLLILMITGCCAGSTGGGLKIIRILIMFKMIKAECRNMLNPRAVNQIKINGKPVSPAVVKGVSACCAVYGFPECQ